MKTNVVVEFDDILNIGHTACQENGKLVILCDVRTTNIEHILLRNILSIKGYSIVSVDDFVWDNGEVDVQFTTDMDWSEYQQIAR
jgi:hypothetical protein